MQHNDIVIAYKNSLTDAYEKKKKSCSFKRHFLLKTCPCLDTLLFFWSSSWNYIYRNQLLCMQHLVKFLQNQSPLKTDVVLLSISFIGAERFELQAQLGWGHVFNWQAPSQKTGWLIDAAEPKFVGSDLVNPEEKHTIKHKHSHVQTINKSNNTLHVVASLWLVCSRYI